MSAMDSNQLPPTSPTPAPAQPLVVAPAPASEAAPADPQIAAPVPASSLLPTPPERLLTAPPRTSWGALIGISIILAVLVIGALYFWGAKLAERDAGFQDSNVRTDIAR